jgi:hypothetical protein
MSKKCASSGRYHRQFSGKHVHAPMKLMLNVLLNKQTVDHSLRKMKTSYIVPVNEDLMHRLRQQDSYNGSLRITFQNYFAQKSIVSIKFDNIKHITLYIVLNVIWPQIIKNLSPLPDITEADLCCLFVIRGRDLSICNSKRKQPPPFPLLQMALSRNL